MIPVQLPMEDTRMPLTAARGGSMAHHKRRRPKSRRSGCLMCKHWKVPGLPRDRRLPHSEQRRIPVADQDVFEMQDAEADRRLHQKPIET